MCFLSYYSFIILTVPIQLVRSEITAIKEKSNLTEELHNKKDIVTTVDLSLEDTSTVRLSIQDNENSFDTTVKKALLRHGNNRFFPRKLPNTSTTVRTTITNKLNASKDNLNSKLDNIRDTTAMVRDGINPHFPKEGTIRSKTEIDVTKTLREMNARFKEKLSLRLDNIKDILALTQVGINSKDPSNSTVESNITIASYKINESKNDTLGLKVKDLNLKVSLREKLELLRGGVNPYFPKKDTESAIESESTVTSDKVIDSQEDLNVKLDNLKKKLLIGRAKLEGGLKDLRLPPCAADKLKCFKVDWQNKVTEPIT